MSIFGLEPGAGARLAIVSDLRRRVATWPFGDAGFVYKGGADVVLRHGTYYQGGRLPPEYAHLAGPPSRCFLNSIEAVQANPADLRYCEGFYMVDGIATEHGWCLDADNQVVELTFPTDPDAGYVLAGSGMPLLPPERWAYMGVVIPTSVTDACEFVPALGRSHAVTDSGGTGEPFVSELLRRPYPWS